MNKSNLPDYYKNQIELHKKLEKQLRKQLMEMERKAEEKKDYLFRQDIEDLLKKYQYPTNKALDIIECMK